MMDLNDNEAINWQSQDVEPGRIITDSSAMASGFRDPGRSIQIGLNRRQIQMEVSGGDNLPGRIWHGLGGKSLGSKAVEKMTQVGSDPSIATRPNVLPEQRIEHMDSVD